MIDIKKARPSIVVLGGGTGTFTVLSGLKYLAVDLTAIVSIADDGGSTGRLRDEQGVLPPGDIRQCLAALAEGDDALRRLLNFRFSGGELDGHNFGNLLITALQKMYGSAESAVKMAHKILRVRGRVIPVSAQSSTLYAELEDMTVVEGEHAIDDPVSMRSPISRCFLDPVVLANPDAVDAIMEADAIVLGPGDLHTSLIPVLLVEGIRTALEGTKAKKIFVMNLVSKKAQTEGYTARRFVGSLDPYYDSADLDYVIINNQPIPPRTLERYTKVGEGPVVDDFQDDEHFQVVREDVLSGSVAKPVNGDRLSRNLLRHDQMKLAKVILEIVEGVR
ncbi:MAG: YvcK family protein [Patescibacteria group bacterium]|nr:YvcK family protein [Patescibacteria group bacterium]